jgi:hypothetical protein
MGMPRARRRQCQQSAWRPGERHQGRGSAGKVRATCDRTLQPPWQQLQESACVLAVSARSCQLQRSTHACALPHLHVCCCVCVDALHSLLEQLRAEMQSGTFDLKQAGAYTETLTLDAGCAAARQLQPVDSTPAPASAAELRAAAGAASGSRPASALMPGIASCLKSSSTAAAAPGTGAGLMSSAIPEHSHAARAVTFAADVHDAATTEDYGRRPVSCSAGGCSTPQSTAVLQMFSG